VAVPIDDLADAEQLHAALVSSAARLICTTTRHLEACGEIPRTHAARVILVDEDECDGRRATRLLSLLGERTEDLPTRLPTSRRCCPGRPAPPARPRHSC
jgi:hypothetical protein